VQSEHTNTVKAMSTQIFHFLFFRFSPARWSFPEPSSLTKGSKVKDFHV